MKQFFRFSILLLALLLPALAMAHDFEVDGIYYNINGNEATVTYYGSSPYDASHSYSGSVVIPATVTYSGTTYPVTAIGNSAFSDCSGLISIDIPNSVTSIGGGAFYNCSGLTSIAIPNSVTSIGSGAFFYCSSLTSIDIPNSVTEIGMNAFNSCTGLTSIVMPEYLTKINEGTFSDCTSLTGIDIPNSVTEIGNFAFYKCSGLTSIDIPNSVTEIGMNAFYSCTGLTSIDIPNSVTSIGVSAFCNCTGLTSIVVESGNPKYDSRNNCNAIIETASNTLIVGCENTAIPNTVTAIGNSAFDNFSGLTSIDIPNSVTSIGEGAFWGCSGLTSITIPNSVTFIGDGAFHDCTGLTSVHIHDLDAWCKIDFNNFYSNPLYYAQHLFIDGEETTDLVIPESVTSIGGYAFYGCTGLTNVTIGKSVTSIGGYAFYDCTGLTSVTIPNSVTSIGEEAFYGCSGLTSVTIPNSVTSVGGKAFYNCSGLTDVYCYIADPLRVSLAGDAFDLYDGDASERTLHVLPGTTEAYYYNEWYWYFEQVIEDLIPEPEPLPGDVNGDREVNIADVNAVINIILSGNGNNTAADVNGDGEINIADVNAVIDIILNLVVVEEHEWVDLGLPSGTLWATCNVGASSPEELGSYFAWGETATKDFYDWSTYKWCNNNYMKMTKYCTVSNYGNDGFVDNKTELDLEDDAAYVNWGPSWRIPSYEQFEELCTSCTSLWTQHNGVNGLMFTGPNGNNLFLPATGMLWGKGLGGVGADGYYWSRTLYNYPNDAFILIFKSNVLSYWDCSYRSIGLTVRAVRASN